MTKQGANGTYFGGVELFKVKKYAKTSKVLEVFENDS